MTNKINTLLACIMMVAALGTTAAHAEDKADVAKGVGTPPAQPLAQNLKEMSDAANTKGKVDLTKSASAAGKTVEPMPVQANNTER